VSILNSDLKWYGSGVMPDDDTVTAIGGAVDVTKKVEFVDITGLAQIVGSTSVDTTQTVTLSVFLVSGGAVVTEVHTLNGTIPVLFGSNILEILKGVKSATTVGDIAVENQAVVRTGTATAGGVETITLDAGASNVDNFYQDMVIRITAGTGINQIREIIQYTGASQVAEVSYAWATQPDATSQFRISQGMVFEKKPNEIFQVRRPFFNSAADVPGGATKTYFDKIFFANWHGSIDLTGASIIELVNPLNDVTFGLATSVNDSGTNGIGNNRQQAPAGISFATTPQVIPGGAVLAHSGTNIGVWLKRTLAPGQAAANVVLVMRGTGFTQ